MAEKHILGSTGAGTTAEVMQQIYAAIVAYGSTTGIRLTVDGSTTATHNGTALGTPDGTVAWWGNNSYMVVEPVAAMPGGGRWQCKIGRTSTNVLTSQWAPNGGWTVAAPTYAGLAVSAVTTWNDGTPPGATATYYISMSNLETYAAGVDTYGYSYLRVLIRRSSAADDAQFVQGLYVGGYIPADPTTDTKPSVMLCGSPRQNGGSLSWSYATANASCPNRAPTDNVHTYLDYANGGHCFTTGMLLTTYAKSRDGKLTNKNLYLFGIAAACELGSFGPYTMWLGALTRTDNAPDASAEYLVVGELMIRWKPSA